MRQVLVWQVSSEASSEASSSEASTSSSEASRGEAGSSEASSSEAGCTYFLTYCVPAVEGLEVGQPLDAGELGRDAGLVRVGVRVRASVRLGSGLG